MKYKTIEINGIPCVTRHQFAEATNMTLTNVNQLTSRGNRIRKLKKIKIPRGNNVAVLIPASEITEYVFAAPGPSNKMYRFRQTDDGNFEKYLVTPVITEYREEKNG